MAITTIPIVTLSSEFLSSAVNVPINSTKISLQPTSDSWVKDGRTILIQIEQSFDGGSTFQHWVSYTIEVGFLDKNGLLPLIEFTLFNSPNTKIRARITPSASVRVGAVVTIT